MKEILATALDLPPSQRVSWLAGACSGDPELRREIEALLEYSDEDGFIDQPAIADAVAIIDRNDAESLVGQTVGRYRIEELIGEGGVGAVYRAVRDDEDLEHQIALKLLKRGMDSAAILRRFRDERRILARLDHPNIARFLDAGMADDGRPYFVMEYLEGRPIHAYCRQNELTVRERLELFLPVCAAVEFSHRNLVIHRDLKATNILVSEGRVPKLLDYGIAKLLDRDTSDAPTVYTQALDRMLTPDYASPEQLAGEAITTAADVYSLGVLLFELLTDSRPFQRTGMSMVEMARMAAEAEPPKPSSAAPDDRRRQLAGDLDTIVMKAMHPARERRYASAEALADDIRRYLAGRPVHARPETTGYRLRKFVGRNRTAVIAAVFATLLIIAAAFTAVYQSAIAQSKDREARRRFVEIRELASGLLVDLDAALENVPGATAARELLARKVLHYLDGLARTEVRDAALQRDLAGAYERLADVVGGVKASNLGDSGSALESYRKALAIYERVGADLPGDVTLLRDRSRTHSRISDVLALTGAHVAALEEERKALELRLAWEKAAPSDRMAKRAIASSLQELAGDLDRLGRFQEALDNRFRVLNILENLHSSPKPEAGLRSVLGLANRRVGRSLLRLGRGQESLAYTHKAIELEREELAAHPSSTGARSGLAYALVDLGGALVKLDRPLDGLPYLTEALAMRRETAEADPKDWRAASLLASARFQYGRALVRARQFARGIRELRDALALRESVAARNPKNLGARGEVAEAAAALADALAERQQMTEAAELYERASAIYSELRSRGSLTMELGDEPARVEAALRQARARR